MERRVKGFQNQKTKQKFTDSTFKFDIISKFDFDKENIFSKSSFSNFIYMKFEESSDFIKLKIEEICQSVNFCGNEKRGVASVVGAIVFVPLNRQTGNRPATFFFQVSAKVSVSRGISV